MTKGYTAVPLFADVSFTTPAGSATALVGPNGSGKTTMLRCVLGAEPLDGGTVELDGRELDERDPAVRAAVAASVGEQSTFGDLSVLEHLDLLACAHDVERPASTVDAVLAATGLTAVADQLPVTLSGGQRRRFALASCFVRPRRLLVLDEPEQNLDADGRRLLVDWLLREKAGDIAVLFASHDAAIVDAVADDVVRIGA